MSDRMGFKEAMGFGLVGHRRTKGLVAGARKNFEGFEELSEFRLPDEWLDPEPEPLTGNLLIGHGPRGGGLTRGLARIASAIVNEQERQEGRPYDEDLWQMTQDLAEATASYEDKMGRFRESPWSYLFPLTRKLVAREVMEVKL